MTSLGVCYGGSGRVDRLHVAASVTQLEAVARGDIFAILQVGFEVDDMIITEAVLQFRVEFVAPGGNRTPGNPQTIHQEDLVLDGFLYAPAGGYLLEYKLRPVGFGRGGESPIAFPAEHFLDRKPDLEGALFGKIIVKISNLKL